MPFLNSLGLDCPAYYDKATDQYIVTFPFPSRFDVEAKRWIFEEGQIGWDKVIVRWKARGPNNHKFVSEIQRGYGELNGGTVGTRRWKDIIA